MCACSASHVAGTGPAGCGAAAAWTTGDAAGDCTRSLPGLEGAALGRASGGFTKGSVDRTADGVTSGERDGLVGDGDGWGDADEPADA